MATDIAAENKSDVIVYLQKSHNTSTNLVNFKTHVLGFFVFFWFAFFVLNFQVVNALRLWRAPVFHS